MIPLWKGKNPIYFGVITIIPFDNLYRRAYFVMYAFLVFLYYIVICCCGIYLVYSMLQVELRNRNIVS